jgi:L-asparaginase II
VPAPRRLALDVVATRGDLVESRHRVHAAAVHADGSLRAFAGDAHLVTFWRSCAKPLQVLPLVRAGGLERYGWGTDELALACASHGGEPEHVAVAERMLATIGLETGDLACGTHEPLSRRGAQLVREKGGQVTRLHNNCSGKHAAMLARALIGGWPTAGYEHADHPVQREALDEVARWTGVAASDIGIGIDGCGVTVFALPLAAMALAYARLGDALASGQEPAARIIRAMIARPFLLGGTERFDTVLTEETEGRIVAKVGAEGVHSVLIPAASLGLALKVEDGNQRAQHIALLAALVQMGFLTEPLSPRLAEFARRPVKNTRGEVVGELRGERSEERAETGKAK